jgi:hypothetical protein
VGAKLTKQLFVVVMADQIYVANNNAVLTWRLCLSNFIQWETVNYPQN